MKKKAFTLVELLAVIVILAIILSIAVPSITGIINSTTKRAFESDAKLVLKGLEYKLLEDDTYDITSINEINIESILGISADNYASVNIKTENNVTTIVIVGNNKWDGLVAYGKIGDIKIVNVNDYNGDISKPVITMLGTSPVNINVGNVYNDAGATANDDIDGNITDNIVVTNAVNINVIGIYTVTYNVSDSSGNVATPVVRTVNVVDGTKPVITILGTNPINIIKGSAYNDAGATAMDDVDGDITANIVVTSTVNPNIVGTYTVTYNVSDSSNNEANSVIRTVNVLDGDVYILGTEKTPWSVGYTYSSGVGSLSQSKQADHLYLYAYKPDGTGYQQVTYVTDQPVDLTNFKTLKVDWEWSRNNNTSQQAGYIILVVSKTKMGSYLDDVSASIEGYTGSGTSGIRVITSLDVSSLTGTYYIRIHTDVRSSIWPGWAEMNLYKLWLEP